MLLNTIKKAKTIIVAWNKGSGCGPRYKVLLPNELSEYLEWYQLNV